MMECPRCGFTQPEDRYCANCGLNIAAFAAKPKPWTQRILGKPVFYLALAVLSGIALVQIVKRYETPASDRTGLVAIDPAQPVAKTQSEPTLQRPPPTAEAPPQNKRPALYPKPAAPTEAMANQTAPAESAETQPISANEEIKPAAEAPVPRPPAQIEFIFVEMGRETWNALATDGKIAGEQGGLRALSFSSRDRIQSAMAAARRLPGQRQVSTQPSSTASLHFPIAVSQAGAPTGLFLDFSVIKSEGTNIELDFAGQIHIRHEGNQDSHLKAEFLATFNTQGALILAGFLPRRNLIESAIPAVTNSPVVVLTSPDYLEGQSEVILIIQGR